MKKIIIKFPESYKNSYLIALKKDLWEWLGNIDIKDIKIIEEKIIKEENKKR